MSSQSKTVLQSGSSEKMTAQLKKLSKLFQQSTQFTKGQLHRHLIALKQETATQLRRQMKSRHNNDLSFDTTSSEHYQHFELTVNIEVPLQDGDSQKSSVRSPTVSSRYMQERKQRQVLTRKKAKEQSMNERIHKYYYKQLTQLTKMRPPEQKPSYSTRIKARVAGTSFQERNPLLYEEKFTSLIQAVQNAWKPRDNIQRTHYSKGFFSRLCSRIMHSMRKCTSADGDRRQSMDTVDNLFSLLQEFKRKSPTIDRKREYRGGGCRKHSKTDNPCFETLTKQRAVRNGNQSFQIRSPVARDKVSKPKLSIPHAQTNLLHFLMSINRSVEKKSVSPPSTFSPPVHRAHMHHILFDSLTEPNPGQSMDLDTYIN